MAPVLQGWHAKSWSGLHFLRPHSFILEFSFYKLFIKMHYNSYKLQFSWVELTIFSRLRSRRFESRAQPKNKSKLFNCCRNIFGNYLNYAMRSFFWKQNFCLIFYLDSTLFNSQNLMLIQITNLVSKYEWDFEVILFVSLYWRKGIKAEIVEKSLIFSDSVSRHKCL